MKTNINSARLANQTACGTAILGLTLLMGVSNASAVIYPQRLAPSDLNYISEAVTGVIMQPTGGNNFSIGSGAVVGHPKVLLTCAHVNFNKGFWLSPSNLKFTARHHAAAGPTSGVTLRDYFKYDSYSAAVRSRGQDSREAYNVDIIAGYSYANLAGGYSAGYWSTGATNVLTNASYWKKLTGYPVERTQNYFMHRVGPFTGSFRQYYGAFYTISGATSYGGNSGGPVYAWDAGKRDWFVAGVFVSSDRTSFMGVRALDVNGVKLLNLARSVAGR